MNKIHKRNTLMRWSKEDLVEHCMALEYNIDVLNENFDRQYDNCIKMISDMDLLNKGYKNRKEKIKI